MIIRPATTQDARSIRHLIHQVGINPFSLNWQRFVVAVDAHGLLLGCGQIKPHADGSRELASIAVQPAFQRQGIGRAVIEHLLARAAPPLYLTCRAVLQPFYEKFGFYALSPRQMPPYFRRIWRITQLLRGLFPRMGSLRVMRRG